MEDEGIYFRLPEAGTITVDNVTSAQPRTSLKHEIRNSKQFEMTKVRNSKQKKVFDI